MSSPKVVDVEHYYSEEPGYYPHIRSKIEASGGELVLASAKTEDEIIAVGRDATVILVEEARAPITARVIESLRLCRGIVKCSIGVDHVDIDVASRLGIVVCNAAGYCTEDVSDHTIGLILSCVRGIHSMDRTIRRGGWFDFPAAGTTRRVRELTLGVVGFGNIGKAVVRKMAAFQTHILVNDPYVAREPGIEFVSLRELLSRSDIVSLHVPLTAETRSLLGKDEFAAMKPTAYLINTSRGPVVDEDALAQALQDRRIAAAGLDVMVQEPLPPSSRLLKLDNVVLTPHYAGHSSDSMLALRDMVADSAAAFLEGYFPPAPVNPAVQPRVPLKPWKSFVENRSAR